MFILDETVILWVLTTEVTKELLIPYLRRINEMCVYGWVIPLRKACDFHHDFYGPKDSEFPQYLT